MLKRYVDDYNLVQRCREGDTEAHDTLLDRLIDNITRYVSNRVPPQDAPDVIQDIFAAVAFCIRDNRYLGRSALETFVYRIVSNRVADYFRKLERSKELLLVSDVLPERSVDPWEAINNNILLQQLSSDLSEDHQEVLELKLAGLDFGEISDKLDFHYEGVRSRYRRCVDKIRTRAEIYRVEQTRRY